MEGQFLETGQILDGRFLIDKIIGKGGQGVVYQVRHLEWDRDLALKLPLPKVVREDRARELYLKEAEAWIRLGVHPNIVRCWFVRPLGKLPALFLDLMSGGSLGSKIESGGVVPGQWDRILRVLLQVTEGLVHAHSKGMVHRDLKPDNLMIAGDGRVCITDFGLVKTLNSPDLTEGLDGPLPGNASVTAGAMGTPRYGAPEQWLNPKSVTFSTDLYSLGCIMFELICGQRPFDPPGELVATIDIIERHIGQEPPDPRSIRDDIPPRMSELCLQLLAKYPKARPQSAEEVLAVLSELLDSHGNGAYQRPARVPAGEHPDLLNNAAASLSSLGKNQKARELLLKGLMLEAGHQQCLYNLVLLDRIEGAIEQDEAIRRLSRAKTKFGLALFHIDDGKGKEAAQLLGDIPESQKTGLVHRYEGDALMYAREFDKARVSYQKAAEKIPQDVATNFRLQMAEKRTLCANGHIYFPSAKSCYRGHSHRPSVKLSLSADADTLLFMDESEILGLSMHESSVTKRAKRELYAGPVVWTDVHGSVLLIQERAAFEIWSLNRFEMIMRMEARVVARDEKLQRLLIYSKDGLCLLDRVQQSASRLSLSPEIDVSKVLASFTHDENGLGFLTSDGRLASLNAHGEIVPLPWPSSIEDPGGVVHLCLGEGFAAVGHRNGTVRCYCLSEYVISCELELGFLPSSIHCDESGHVLVASSPKEHVIFDKHGRVLRKGVGPCALDGSKGRCLIWVDSTLRLYQLRPFALLRTWEEAISLPQVLQISRDGRRALSLDDEGHYRLWEVDEESRVCEPNMLMTPGQTYPEIIASFGEYSVHFRNALACFDEKRIHDCYQTLNKAREVSGFHQAKDALELQWALCQELKREKLEAIWERLFFPEIVAGQLTSDSRYLLLTRPDVVELFELAGPQIESRLRIPAEYHLVSGYFLSSESGESTIIAFGRDGELAYYFAHNGENRFSTRIKTGRISSVRFQAETALIQNTSGQAFSLDLTTATLSEPIPLKGSRLERAFLLEDKRAAIVTHHDHLMADLGETTTVRGMPGKVEHIQAHISFCKDCEGTKLRLIGFTNGTLVLADKKTGTPLFSTELGGEAVSGAALHLKTALGVAASDNGRLTFLDLASGAKMEEFIAHAEGIDDLNISSDGRYVTTLSKGGQYQLWEVSWLLTDKPGQSEIPWLPVSTLDRLSRFFGRR